MKTTIVYLLHFAEPIGTEGMGAAQHYLGSSTDLDAELERHRNGSHAAIMREVNRLGISWELARTWPGDRKLERRLKERGGASRLCPKCGIYPRDGGGTMHAGYSVIAAELNKRFRPQPPITRQQVAAWHLRGVRNMKGEPFPAPVAERRGARRTTPRWLFDTGQVVEWFRAGTRGPSRRGWRVWSEYEPERGVTDVTTALV